MFQKQLLYIMVGMALDNVLPSKRKQAKNIFLVCFLLASICDHAAGFCPLSAQRTVTTTTQNVRACHSALQSTRQQFPGTSTTLSSEADLPLQFDRTLLEKRYEKELSRRWTDFLKESAPLVQQSAKLWASGRLKRDDPSLASVFRQTLTKLGPAFVKLGQILSVREDILGPVWSAELSKLQNSVDAFGGREAVDDAIANNVTLKDRLLWFEPNPVAVASIAQVHKGQWLREDGTTTEVAIKVLRPNVAYQVGIDLCVLLRAGDILSEWAPRILPVSRVDWQALLAGLAKGLWEEVDLSGEATRQTRFGQNMESVPRVFVPKVLAYNRNVMISEWVDGLPLRSIPSMDNRLKAAQALMRDAYCQSMYVNAFFHADGHGGNLLWIEKEDESSSGDSSKGELCIIDCGLMVDIEPSAAEGLLRLSLHLASRDWTRVVDDVIALGFLPEDLPRNLKVEARGIARRIIGPYLDVGGGAKAASVYSISTLFDDVSAATMKLPTSLPPDMILLARAVIQLEGLALRAYPNYRLVDDILPVAARIALRSTTAQSNGSEDDKLTNDVRSSLLYDLIYEESEDLYGSANGEANFSFQRLLQLLGTARGGSSTAEIPLSIEEFVEELLQADAARDVVSQEVMNVIDALIRDSLWRGVDTVEERGPQFVARPFLWNLFPSPKKTLESLVPRISEQEQLILLRIVESLKELDENVSSTRPLQTSNGRYAFDEIPLVKLATIPGVSKSIRDVSFSVFRGDTKSRAAVDAVFEKMSERLRGRLVQTGVPQEVASFISTAVLRRPWQKINT